MTNLYLTILTHRPKVDGTYNIKVAVNHQRKTAYIPTPFDVERKQWRNGQVVGHVHAAYINAQLQGILLRYMQIRDSNPKLHGTAGEIRDWLVFESTKTNDLITYGGQYIDQLVENGQKSYAQNMGYTVKYLSECFGGRMLLEDITVKTIERWEKWLRKRGNSDTTINIRMSHFKALLNSAVADELVEYKVFPFVKYTMPQKAVRDIAITRDEFVKLRDAAFDGVAAKRLTVARDLFMLSFYLAGINLTDIMDAELDGNILTFVRKKTAGKKRGEKKVSITIQPEAREIIGKYYTSPGFDFGYKYRDYEQFRSYVTHSLNRIGQELKFESKLMFYSARKTFCQFGYELGVPLYVLEYAIGQTVKDANNRPIFGYIKIMRSQADAAIRTIIDYANGENPTS